MKALLLDLDDTLVTYSPGADEAWLNMAPPSLERDRLLAAFKESRRWQWATPDQHRLTRVTAYETWAKVFQLTFAACDHPISETKASEMSEAFLKHLIDHLILLPGVKEALREWRERGVLLALVTNGDARVQRQKLARHDLAGYFDALIFESESPAGKPDPESYELALQKLVVTPDEAWMAGDNLEFDVAGPQRVGIRAAWVNRSGKGLPPGSVVKPDCIVQSVSELGLKIFLQPDVIHASIPSSPASL